MLDAGQAKSLDEILCDPTLAVEFDAFAHRLAPGHRPVDYRWAALRLRKVAKAARTRAAALTAPRRFEESNAISEFDPEGQPESPGLYLVSENSTKKLYVGETLNLRRRLSLQFGGAQQAEWSNFAGSLFIQTLPMTNSRSGMLTWQSCMVRKYKRRPRLNYHELASS